MFWPPPYIGRLPEVLHPRVVLSFPLDRISNREFHKEKKENRGRKNSAYEKQGERLCFPQIVGRIEGDQTQLIETDLAGLAGRGEGLSSAGDSLFGTGFLIPGAQKEPKGFETSPTGRHRFSRLFTQVGNRELFGDGNTRPGTKRQRGTKSFWAAMTRCTGTLEGGRRLKRFPLARGETGSFSKEDKVLVPDALKSE
ncbi:hypothetical protein MRB53_036277 [Persea americana]|nr:hypothetical protein MRB53_036455 [Persea americana]KAJ8614864.1 hypothetical protein MRB53_036277 [Persea americana]